MKIEIDENDEFLLTEVYTGIGLKTEDGETLNICMRDTGFEFNYNGVLYSAQQGKIKKMGDEHFF